MIFFILKLIHDNTPVFSDNWSQEELHSLDSFNKKVSELKNEKLAMKVDFDCDDARIDQLFSRFK
ncbi:MAG: hypothetical protein EAX96_04145 [Candidatus Lokiarchaeota archaeon]|nr:hypothetical protein [Candidatus Lokiarchaeota archaeon]